MLKIKFIKKDGIIEEIVFTGHAEFDDIGKDIVCASASSILITTVNAIVTFDKEAIKYEQKSDFVLKKKKKFFQKNMI